MRKLPGKRRIFFTALLTAVLFLWLPRISRGEACQGAIGAGPASITSISPNQWKPGNTYTVATTGVFPGNSNMPGCAYYEMGGSDANGYIFDLFGTEVEDNSFPFLMPSNAIFVSAMEIDFTVTVAADAPNDTITLNFTCDGCGTNQDPQGTVQIVSGAPTITSVTPLGWWAGQKQDITITGTNFLTSADAHGPSKVTATATGVTLNNVQVVSATQITASVKVTKDASAETVTLTVTNPATGNGSPNSATASPAPVVLPVPVIDWRGKKISGDNANTQKVKTGQPVELTATPATLPGGFTISQSTWDIDGTTIKSYAADDSGITLEETDLDKQNTSFYWLYPDDGLNVTYDYCATGSDGMQYCTSPQAKAAFNATGPNASLSTTDSSEATIEQLEDCDSNGNLLTDTEPYLGYGDLNGPGASCDTVWRELGMKIIPQTGAPGIKLTATGISASDAVFVQLIDSVSRTYTSSAGSYTCTTAPNLDTKYPYQPVTDASNIPTNVAADGPQIPLPSPDQSGEMDFLATMYLLWQPGQLSGTSTQSIPVPIGHQQWTFVASTDQKQPIGKGKWKRPTLTAHGDSGSYAASQDTDNNLHGYPIFTGVATEVCP